MHPPNRLPRAATHGNFDRVTTRPVMTARQPAKRAGRWSRRQSLRRMKNNATMSSFRAPTPPMGARGGALGIRPSHISTSVRTRLSRGSSSYMKPNSPRSRPRTLFFAADLTHSTGSSIHFDGNLTSREQPWARGTAPKASIVPPEPCQPHRKPHRRAGVPPRNPTTRICRTPRRNRSPTAHRNPVIPRTLHHTSRPWKTMVVMPIRGITSQNINTSTSCLRRRRRHRLQPLWRRAASSRYPALDCLRRFIPLIRRYQQCRRVSRCRLRRRHHRRRPLHH